MLILTRYFAISVSILKWCGNEERYEICIKFKPDERSR